VGYGVFFKKILSGKGKNYHQAELDADENIRKGRDPTGMYEIALLHYMIALTTRPVAESFLPDREPPSLEKNRADAEGKHSEGLEGALRVIEKIENYAKTLRDRKEASELYVMTASYKTMVDGVTRIRNEHTAGIDSIRFSLGIAPGLDALEEFRVGLVAAYQKAMRNQRYKQ
jgi:hypothetical protein